VRNRVARSGSLGTGGLGAGCGGPGHSVLRHLVRRAEHGQDLNQKELTRQADNGVGLVRQYIWWDRMERSPGVYDWSRMDQLVKDASARDVQILPTLLYPPEFYNSEPEGYSGAPYPPDDPQTMARFATKMVERYGTNGLFWCDPPRLPWLPPPPCREPYAPITYWEVWNEPDYKSWWKGQQSPDPAEYLELLKAVSIAIKAADPAAKVVLGSMTTPAAAPEAATWIGSTAWARRTTSTPSA